MSRSVAITQIFWTFAAIAGFAGLAVLGLLAVALLPDLMIRWTNDTSHSDYRRYDQIFGEIRKKSADRESASDTLVDFSPLNSGDWTTVCVFGGYTRPSITLQKFSAKISEADLRRLSWLRFGFRMTEIEEYEAMIVYLDSNRMAHFMHFPSGFGAGGQHFEQCIDKPQTHIPLGGDA